MPWLHHVDAVLRGVVPRPAVRRPRSPPCCSATAIRAGGCRSRSRRATSRAPRRRAAPERYPGVNGAGALRRGDLRRLPLVRPLRPAPAVPVRLRAVLRALPLRRPARGVGAAATDVVATVRVTNSGGRAGSTVAQAYVGFPRAAGEPPQQLKGYEKVRAARRGAARGACVPPEPADLARLRRGARRSRGRRRAATRWRSGARRATWRSARRSSWAATGAGEPR